MIAFAIVSLLAALASFAILALVLIKQIDYLKSQHNDAMQLARANSDMKFMPVIIQTAMAVRQSIDEAVQRRITIINRANGVPQTEETPAAPIEEPPVGMSGIIDDVHEIARGVARFRRDSVDDAAYTVREPGIGAPEVPPEQI